MMNSLPLVSIGMPLYNEGRYIRQTLDSLVSQDYQNIEILISDNASTDDTQKICEEYQARIPYIRYQRFKENRGAGENFAKVLHDAKGAYFMWGCGHDAWSSNYISECVQKLLENQRSVIAFGCSNWIDQNGNLIEKNSGYTDTRGMEIIARYFSVLWGNVHPILGLIRTDLIKQYLIRSIVGEDMVALSYLALHGDFVHAPKASWSRREFRFESTYKERLDRYRGEEQQVTRNGLDRILPLARLPIALVNTVLKADISVSVKIAIIALLLPTLPVRYFSGKRQYK